ncbi:MAG: hypothetical protein ABI333_05320 [bacterium]
MSEAKTDVLDKQVAYTGEGISVRSLEGTIGNARERQNGKVAELSALRERNIELQKTLGDEVKKLRKLSDYVTRGQLQGGFWTNFKEIMSYIPGLRRLSITRRSIEELLRQQYEISSLRVKEAAEFADKLRAAQADLYEEITRLNDKIVEAAQNEETAAEYLLELQALREQLDAELEGIEPGSKVAREKQMGVDKTRQLLSEHSTQLQLYHTAEERLARLKENTYMLAETIGNLYSDITQYVTAASEKLDLVSGQIQAIGTAADASMVMLEMKRSLDVLTESMNQTTQFVSETQIYFRTNLDKLMKELEVFDETTESVMEKNLETSRMIEEQRIAEALQVALARRDEGSGEAAPPAAE